MTISYFLPLSIVLLFRLGVDDSVSNRSTNCCVPSFFLYYYTFERGSLEFFSCFSIRYFSIYYLSFSQFRRFDASSFESSFDTYMLYRGDLLSIISINNVVFLLFFSFWKRIVRILNSRVCSNRHILFPPSFRINNPQPAGHLSLKSLITNR